MKSSKLAAIPLRFCGVSLGFSQVMWFPLHDSDVVVEAVDAFFIVTAVVTVGMRYEDMLGNGVAMLETSDV